MTEYIPNKILLEYYNEIDSIFKKIKSYRKHLDVIFVFGGAEDGYTRNKFLNYVETNNLTPFNFITIESLYKDIVNFSKTHKTISAKKIKLANLELEAINNAYSILLFPESPGSFAELGFFSADEKTREKILVMNNSKYDHEESYINELIKLVHEERQISPFYFSVDREIEEFEKYLKKVIHGYKDFDEYNSDVFESFTSFEKEIVKLSLIYETIKIIPYLSVGELTVVLRFIFKEKKIKVINFDRYIMSMVSLLVVSGLIKREEIDTKHFFIVSDENYNLFLFEDFTDNEYKKKLKISMLVKKSRGLF
ncbi:retron St85 family effector protein [Arcobacter caeni]|uniref:Uncharacterized protein n=1 Tax=Arcobacter caeni TaxID=1912877 RepID=A0A363CX36_9BACT|nr:retron St85 family effector protein [Arcobacter caeni]PUE63629.1 hypothetical protein B0174_10410 [Arcobacter caeni]